MAEHLIPVKKKKDKFEHIVAGMNPRVIYMY